MPRSAIFLKCLVGVVAMSLMPVTASDVAENVQRLVKDRECEACDLTAAGLSYDLKSVKLAGATMVRAVLYGADLTDADLTDANLTGANLTRANLTRTNLTRANLDGANLTGATGADLSTATTTQLTVCPNETYGPCQ